MIYLDNAATTGKKPETVIRAVTAALREYSANPGRSGHKSSLKTATAVYGVREKAANFFGASGPENVVFTAGCTQSINFCLKGVLTRGDHIVISDSEHNAVMRPLTAIGADYSVAAADLSDDQKTVENFRNALRPDTKMIFVTGASNVYGKRMPIEKLGALCRQKNILFGVDAAQIAGVVPIDMKRQKIDFLCVAAHKGLYAPMGVGIMIAEKPLPNTVIEGGTGTESANLRQPITMPERLESGTLNVPGILGLGAGLEFIDRLGGTVAVYEREMKRFLPFCERVYSTGGVTVYTPFPDPSGWVPVLSCNLEKKTSTETALWLDNAGIAVRAGLHCAPSAHQKIGTLNGGTVRFSPSVFTTEAELYRTASALRQCTDKKYVKNIYEM